MTSPPTQPVTDEQHVGKYQCKLCGHRHPNGWYCKARIASLKAQLVTMREALERADDMLNGRCYQGCTGGVVTDSNGEAEQCQWCDESQHIIKTALSSTADYAGKVVMDKQVWEAAKKTLQERIDKAAKYWPDSLRQGGKG